MQQEAAERELDAPKGLTLSINVSRDDLPRAGLSEDEIAHLSDEDLATIGQRIEDH